MANSELHIKDSVTDQWRQMTSNDLATVKNEGTANVTPAGKSFKQVTGAGQFTSNSSTLFAIYCTAQGVTAGDTIAVKDSGTVILTFTATATNENFSFTPAAGILCSTSIDVGTSLSGGTVLTTAIYEDV